jgi:hypothetical protein
MGNMASCLVQQRAAAAVPTANTKLNFMLCIFFYKQPFLYVCPELDYNPFFRIIHVLTIGDLFAAEGGGGPAQI